MENWAQAEGRVSPVLGVAEAADPAGRRRRRRRAAHRLSRRRLHPLCTDTSARCVGMLPHLPLRSARSGGLRKPLWEAGPVEKGDPPDRPGLLLPFASVAVRKEYGFVYVSQQIHRYKYSHGRSAKKLNIYVFWLGWERFCWIATYKILDVNHVSQSVRLILSPYGQMWSEELWTEIICCFEGVGLGFFLLWIYFS